MATPVAVKLSSKNKGNLLFNNKALFYLEKESGRTFTELAAQLSEGAISFETLNYLVWAGLLHEEPQLTVDDLLERVDIQSDEIMQGIVKAVGEALEQSLPGQDEEQAAQEMTGKKKGQKKAQGKKKSG